MTSDKVKKRGFVCFFNCFVNISFTSLCDLLCLFVCFFAPLSPSLVFFFGMSLWLGLVP